MQNNEKIKKLILFLTLAFGFIMFNFYVSQNRQTEVQVISKPAPVFEYQSLKGESFHLKDAIGKKVILVNFWATWCQPCREEIPVLNEIYKALKSSEKFMMLPLMEDDLPSLADYQNKFQKFLKKVDIDFETFLDDNGQIADLFGTYKIPETFIIGLDGKVIKKYEIITDSDKKKIVSLIQDLMLK